MGDLSDDDLQLLPMGDSSDDDLLVLPELDNLFADDDPEVLRAALDFIEACESSSDDSDQSGDSVASPPRAIEDAAQPQAPAKPRRVTRNRRKEEIAELRVLVAQLETQVAGRKRKLYVPETLPYAVASTLHGDVMMVGADNHSAVWEHISKRQQQQRQLAELENAKLRNMVMDQLKVARDLARTAKRQALLEGRSVDAIGDLEMLAPEPAKPNESSLVVRIYPSRPGMKTRVGMAMPLADATNAEPIVSADAAELEGTPIGMAWKPPAVAATDTSQATRLAWQAALRHLLTRRRATACRERGDVMLNAAITASLVDTRFSEPMWQKSSSTLLGLGSLLPSSHTSKAPVNLGLFRRLEKPVAHGSVKSLDLDSVTSRLGSLSLQKPQPLLPHGGATGSALQTWHRGSTLHAS